MQILVFENFSITSALQLMKIGNINPLSQFGSALLKIADTRQPNKFKISIRKMKRGETVRPKGRT